VIVVNIEFIKTFLILCEQKNFYKAAETLNTVQTTVTYRLKKIEDELGCRLINRNGKSLTLTKEGSIYREYAQKIVDLHDESMSKINPSRLFSSKLRIASIDTYLRYILNNEIINAHRENPHPSLLFIPMHSTEILKYVADGEIDVGYTTEVSHSDRTQHFLAHEEKVVLVCNTRTRLRTKIGENRISLDELSNHIIMDTPLGNLFMGDQEFDLSSFTKEQISMDTMSLMVQYFLENDTLGFMPLCVVKDYLRTSQLKTLEIVDLSSPLTWRVYCTTPKNSQNQSSIKWWLEYAHHVRC